ncbi:unnamed protein product [Acanthoscelides obtectus]|uniref:Uncharacterized protein n=1 Tax=Acanthoscelides obtectus TaxID=200917 RepID=A0A9P0KWD8_ACAOB|nr:unnamed protein product [Acanthoscelides obtectus]CAK1662960.1 hypothetical protein AOBTE_LOCUS23400 [Acanthoscelides obtectus]
MHITQWVICIKVLIWQVAHKKCVDYTPTACAEEETITEEASGSAGPVLKATTMKAGPIAALTVPNLPDEGGPLKLTAQAFVIRNARTVLTHAQLIAIYHAQVESGQRMSVRETELSGTTDN